YTTTALIPFYEDTTGSGVDWSTNVHVTVRMGSTMGHSYRPIVDTGTQGMVFSAPEMDYDFNTPCEDQGTPGWQFLSSSNLLYEGCWVPRDFYFNVGDPANPVVKASVPILAMMYKSECPTFDIASTTGHCPNASVPRIANATGTRMMGVGWGRQYDGLPQGTPDKNPLRNIVSVGTQSMDPATAYSAGYVLDSHGLRVGLTDANTAGISWYALEAHASIPGEYREARACIAVDGATPCVPGHAVVDTGIGQSYLRMPAGTALRFVSGRSGRLVDTSAVRIDFGAPGSTAVATESFTLGSPGSPDVNPDYVSAVFRDPALTYINTGRHAYRAFVTAFDGRNGRYG
ncbi:hypothetical protein B0T26DRAFT_629023, partial [Lasiosphaeria miniovina]